MFGSLSGRASIFPQRLLMRNKTADNLLKINLYDRSPLLLTHSKHIHVCFVLSALLHPLCFSSSVFPSPAFPSLLNFIFFFLLLFNSATDFL